MNVSEVINNRYSTKAFDPNKKISEADFNEIKNMLRMSPSSTNLQPWHFVIAHSEEGKNRIAKSTEGPFHFNTQKIKDASHVVVFCSRIDADEPHMLKVLEQEDKDGRYATP